MKFLFLGAGAIGTYVGGSLAAAGLPLLVGGFAIAIAEILLTFVLLVIAVAFLVSIWKMRPTHRTLYKLAVGLLAGIALQALVGAITVWTGLNAWVVSVHFLISGALVIMATFQVNRTAKELKSREIPRSTKSIGQISFAAWIFSLLAVAFGTVVTGTGPHAGDADAPRHPIGPGPRMPNTMKLPGMQELELEDLQG